MTNLKCFLVIVLILTLQSCILLRNTEIAEYSNYKQISKSINPTNSFIRYTASVEVIEQNTILIHLFDKDSIELNKSYNKYSCLFKSGLISFSLLHPYHSGSSRIKIWEVEEIKYKFLGRKTRILSLRGGIIGGEVTYLNGSIYKIEIRNDKARKHWSLEQFIEDAKVTKCVEFIQI